MTLKRIIRIEEKFILDERNTICKSMDCCVFYSYTDLSTRHSGVIPESDLNEFYEKMEGIKSNGKELYVRRLG